MIDVDLYHDDNEFVLLSKYEKLEAQLKEAEDVIDYVRNSFSTDKVINKCIEYKTKYNKDKG